MTVGWCLGVVVVAQSGHLAELVTEYRTGDAERAIALFRQWVERDVLRESEQLGSMGDARVRAALAVLHSETMFMTSSALGEVHFQRASVLVETLLQEAEASGDAALRVFCRDWYLNSQVRTWPWLRRRFSDDPVVSLAYGTFLEYWSPRADGRGGGTYGFQIGEPAIGTSHGQFGPEVFQAVGELRATLELAPNMVEARVRLGRVLWQLDRWGEAERELQQAIREAEALPAPTMAYLAGLFLGQLHEERTRMEDARRAYERALAVYPNGQAVALALGRLLVATGRESAGWGIVTQTLRMPPIVPDPWTLYFSHHFNAAGPERALRYKALRAHLPRQNY